MLRSFRELVQALEDHPEWRAELRRLILTEELLSLPEVVRELALRVEELAAEVRVLAEAQRRTDERLEQLAARVEELAEAQRRTDERVAQLADAQRRTEETVRQLVVDMKHVKEELGGLSHAVGYGLENLAYRTLPRLLKERFQLTLTEPLRRRFLTVGERQLEVNVWGLATRPDGQMVRVVGEGKTRLSAGKHFKGVERLRKFTRPHWGTEEALVVLVCHVALPGTEEAARRRGWWVVESWELESTPAA